MDYRKVDGGKGVDWFRAGWRLFMQEPLLIFAQFLVILVLAVAANFVPIIGHLAVALFFYVFLAGMFFTVRDLENGLNPRFERLFDGFKQNFRSLLILGLITVGVQLVLAIFFMVTVGTVGLSSMTMGMGMTGMTALFAAISTALVAMLVALILLIPVSMAFFFAVPLVALSSVEPITALKSSFHAVLNNVPAFLVYGLLYLVFSILASIPMGLGWLLLGPITITSLYAAFKDVYGFSPSATPPETVISAGQNDFRQH